jgi:hypothetical protein
MQIFKYKTLEDIKPFLRHGDIPLIAEMVASKYTRRTVESQLHGSGSRTLKPEVIEAANKLIESRELLLNEPDLK